MSKKVLILVFFSFFAAKSQTVYSQNIVNASNSQIHLQEALTPKKGHLSLYSHTDVNTISSPFEEYNIWIVRNAFNVDYSLTDYLLLGLNTNLYQDIHRTDPSNNFDKLLISIKIGSLGFSNDHFFVGGLASFNIPLSDYYNNYAVPYSAGSNEIGLNFLFTYYTDNLFPTESTSFSINLGYYNFMDKDQDISHNSRKYIVRNSSSALNYGFGVLIPTTSLDVILELWGYSYIQQPPVVAYSRENQLFLTFASKLSLITFIKLNLGVDLLLSGNEEETDFSISKAYSILPIPNSDPKSNAAWRAFIGLEFNILPFNQVTDASIFSERKLSKRQANQLIDQLNLQRENKKWSDDQIDDLNKSQLEIEKNLQLLRSILRQN